MVKYLGKYSAEAFALLRIVVGFMFLIHGTQKILGWPGDGEPVEIMSQMGIAGLIELIGGFLIMIGLFADWAGFICSGEMAFAYFMAHAAQDWNPVVNNGEKAIFYCFFFLYLATRGAGIWSVDAMRKES